MSKETGQLKKLIEDLEEVTKDGGAIGLVQPIVWDIKEIAKNGGDISPALPALNKAAIDHGCDHGCPVDGTIAEAEAYYYKNVDKKKLSELLNSESLGVKLGAIRALETEFSKNSESLSLVVKKLVDEDDLVRVDTSTILKLFAKKSKENAKLVLNEIKKANLNRNVREVKQTIWECKGFDIARIGKELIDKDDMIKLAAAEALEYFSFYEENDIREAIPVLVEALNDKNKKVGENAAKALEQAAVRKIELSISELNKALGGAGEKSKEYIAGAITICYVNNKQWDKSVEFLKDKNANIRKGCEKGLEYFFRLAYWDKKLNKDIRVILEWINKAGIDKNLPEIKKIIRKGNERLNS